MIFYLYCIIFHLKDNGVNQFVDQIFLMKNMDRFKYVQYIIVVDLFQDMILKLIYMMDNIEIINSFKLLLQEIN